MTKNATTPPPVRLPRHMNDNTAARPQGTQIFPPKFTISDISTHEKTPVVSILGTASANIVVWCATPPGAPIPYDSRLHYRTIPIWYIKQQYPYNTSNPITSPTDVRHRDTPDPQCAAREGEGARRPSGSFLGSVSQPQTRPPCSQHQGSHP
ncbi:hypothetical protein E2C01_082969 [Portunus trituberculatus]|uniref:Uncharacterized protein n=1 Tax=Portunus trituberculatus TaxID=210409 RepID=A0A5B7J0H8_PORTR|nr:hypothetical protein [Portunus trituberculatus]